MFVDPEHENFGSESREFWRLFQGLTPGIMCVVGQFGANRANSGPKELRSLLLLSQA